MNTMTPPTSTPRTDAAEFDAWQDGSNSKRACAPVSFCRQLERELAAANEQLAAAREELRKAAEYKAGYYTVCNENAGLREELAAAQATLKTEISFARSKVDECATLRKDLQGMTATAALMVVQRDNAETAQAKLAADLAKLREDNAALRAQISLHGLNEDEGRMLVAKRIEAIEAENAALRAENKSITDFNNELARSIAPLRADLKAHEEINKQLIEDKRRLDWLDGRGFTVANHAIGKVDRMEWRVSGGGDSTLRAAIDATRAANKNDARHQNSTEGRR